MTDVIARHDVAELPVAQRVVHLQAAMETARTQLLTLGAGVFAAGALVYTARNYSLSRQAQVTDRYTKTIEQLGSDKLDVRIGAIYALERIANDSARDHPTVIEVLCAFIREHSPEPWPPARAGAESPPRGTRPDVQAALTVLLRRDPKRDKRRIDLSRSNLTGADLRHANLFHAILTGVSLRGANLEQPRVLKGADRRDRIGLLLRANSYKAVVNLVGSGLTGPANLSYSNLIGADLAEANLKGANLSTAYLTEANLNGAKLAGADLTAATLRRANFTRADLTGADLTGADLTGADLTGADLTGADLYGAYRAEQDEHLDGWHRHPRFGRLLRTSQATAFGLEPAEADDAAVE